MDMHRSGRTGDQEGKYIWLRYSTQFTRGGQPHTIEMEIPMPVGASAEEREQLIREAEASLEQMYRQIERRGAGRGQQPSEGSRPQAAPVQAGSHPAPTATAPARTPAPSVPSAQVAAQAIERDTSQAGSPPGKREMVETVAPARASIGSEMPVTPNLSSSASGNIRLPEFIQIIRKWGLTPKDVIDMLQVPNLNNMNYRELLRQLEPLVAQRSKEASKNTASVTGTARTASTPAPASTAARPPAPAPSSPTAPVSTMREASMKPTPSPPPSRPTPPAPANAANRPSPPAPAPPASKPATPAAPPAPGLDGPANIPVYPLPANTLREVPRSYKFDEEEEDDEAEGGTGEDENGMSEALARIKIDELRENPGTAVVSPARLTVLHNLLDSQISDEQFQQLIEGLWNINSDKKLKQNQVETLISWAKEDYFEDEVRAVIAVLRG